VNALTLQLGDKAMMIYVKAPRSKTIELEVNPGITIREIKEMIKDKTGRKLSDQTLIFNSYEPKDSQTLNPYLIQDIRRNGGLQLVLKSQSKNNQQTMFKPKQPEKFNEPSTKDLILSPHVGENNMFIIFDGKATLYEAEKPLDGSVSYFKKTLSLKEKQIIAPELVSSYQKNYKTGIHSRDWFALSGNEIKNLSSCVKKWQKNYDVTYNSDVSYLFKITSPLPSKENTPTNDKFSCKK
jgi:hypothetical protein